MEKEVYFIWLSKIPNLGKNRLEQLRKTYENLEDLWKETNKEKLKQIDGIGEKLSEEIINPIWKKEAMEELEIVRKEKIYVLGLGEKEYPKLLSQIYDPPICIYAQGNIDILSKKSLAIVGSRMASDYAKTVSYYLAYQLAQKHLQVISGMAKGVDSYAHKGAIRAVNLAKDDKVGRTIAVVGTGLGKVYPKENIGLKDEIIASGGLILSEYSWNTDANRYHFPERNRIISGLSRRNRCCRSRRKKWLSHNC